MKIWLLSLTLTLSWGLLPLLPSNSRCTDGALPRLFACTGVRAQTKNFYVAAVKGDVYQGEKKLARRDKLTLPGDLRFTSPEDVLKVVGPTGIHTLQPEAKPGGGYEFLRAVSAELFPAPTARGSFSKAMTESLQSTLPVYNASEGRVTDLLDGERVPFYGLTDADRAATYWVFHTESGRDVMRPATFEDHNVILNLSDFALPDGDSIVGFAWLFRVHHPKRFRKALKRDLLQTDTYLANQMLLKRTVYTEGAERLWETSRFVEPDYAAGIRYPAPRRDEIARYFGNFRPEDLRPAEPVLTQIVWLFRTSGATDLTEWLFPDSADLGENGVQRFISAEIGDFDLNRLYVRLRDRLEQ